jgi:hypothetical protein
MPPTAAQKDYSNAQNKSPTPTAAAHTGSSKTYYQSWLPIPPLP